MKASLDPALVDEEVLLDDSGAFVFVVVESFAGLSPVALDGFASTPRCVTAKAMPPTTRRRARAISTARLRRRGSRFRMEAGARAGATSCAGSTVGVGATRKAGLVAWVASAGSAS